MDAPAVVTALDPTTLSPWLQGLLAILSTIITSFALPWLKQAAAAARQQAELHRVDITASLLNQKEAVVDQVKAYLEDQAAILAADRWPIIAAKIASGQLKTPADVKNELYALGTELKLNTVAYFKANGIDLVATLGEPAIDDLITLAASHSSPFPGKEAAIEIFKTNIVPLLVQKGTAWIRTHYLQNGATPIVAEVQVPTPMSVVSDKGIRAEFLPKRWAVIG